jgi:hypothetical protein
MNVDRAAGRMGPVTATVMDGSSRWIEVMPTLAQSRCLPRT